MSENGFLILDTTRYVTNPEITKLYDYIANQRKDLSLITIISGRKHPSLGTNITSIGCLTVNNSSPFIKDLTILFSHLNSLVNPIQITFFEAIGVRQLKQFELNIMKSTKRLQQLLSDSLQNSINKNLFEHFTHNFLLFRSEEIAGNPFSGPPA